MAEGTGIDTRPHDVGICTLGIRHIVGICRNGRGAGLPEEDGDDRQDGDGN